MSDDLRIFVVEQNIGTDRVDVLMHYSTWERKEVPVGMLAAYIMPFEHEAVILKNSTRKEENKEAYSKLSQAFDEVKRKYGVSVCVDRRSDEKSTSSKKENEDVKNFVEGAISEKSASKVVKAHDNGKAF